MQRICLHLAHFNPSHIRTLSLATCTRSNNAPLSKELVSVSLLSEFGLALTRVLFASARRGRQFQAVSRNLRSLTIFAFPFN